MPPAKTVPWFDGRSLARALPADCILECSAPGQDASAAVAHWADRLRWDAPEAYTREYLRSFGAWDDAEIADHWQNLLRLLWLVCGDLREDPDAPIYLGE